MTPDGRRRGQAPAAFRGPASRAALITFEVLAISPPALRIRGIDRRCYRGLARVFGAVANLGQNMVSDAGSARPGFATTPRESYGKNVGPPFPERIRP
jgi:hypothetical protein